MNNNKIDFKKSVEEINIDITRYINNMIELINKDNNVNEKIKIIKKHISDFESVCDDKASEKEVEVRNFFYRTIFDLIQKLNLLDLMLSVSLEIIDNLNRVVKEKHKKDNPYFMCLIDTYMINGICCDMVNKKDKARELFNSAVELGEKYLDESKKNFHDALNCAYTWAGVYLYNDQKYEESLKCFERVIELFNQVKFEPNYHIREVDSVPNSIQYIKVLKEFLGKR